MLIFQYGSNLSSVRLNSEQRLGGAARVVGIACTEQPYRFRFPVWGGINGCAAAGILPGGEQPVWGVIYAIPEERVIHGGGPGPTLDAIEDEGCDYRRGPIDLRLANGGRPDEEVHTYHPRDPREDLVTEWHYVRHILTGALEHELPRDYVRQIADRAIDNNPALAGPVHRHLVQALGPGLKSPVSGN